MRILLILFISILLTSFKIPSTSTTSNPVSTAASSSKSAHLQLYEDFGLEQMISVEAFEYAMQGADHIRTKKEDIITIIDFTLPSTAKRMVVLDLAKKEVLYHTIVSHGKNSGENYATSFSNIHSSYQSSLGFYTTENTYIGRNGYSLVLNGLEKGTNDQAKARAVVIHGADYCSEDFIKATGRNGRSYGCPALPRALNQEIIDTIKEGSLLYIYANDKNYLANSKFISKNKNHLADNSSPRSSDKM